MYQWGALVGYQSPSEFSFSLENYEQLGLNLITGNLSAEHDAAVAYYGGIARMPSRSEIRELIDYTTISVSGNLYRFVSNINGNVINIYARGEFAEENILRQGQLYMWSSQFIDTSQSNALHVDSNNLKEIPSLPRYRGMLILPVKSS